MSATRTVIGEHDVVALLNAVDGRPKGTEGAVVDDQPTRKWVEVANERGECLDILFVPTEQLRLVGKCPTAAT
ncbi:MAG: hypothetical protein JST08_01665 [Actinobacteria bacterium]|nr:hypothetical protein [Actinomycetota bacterium]